MFPLDNLLIYGFLGILVFLLILHSLLEAHYFLRCFLCVVITSVSRKKDHVLSEFYVQGLCLPSDIDIRLTHMNNARFVRELDFAKLDFYQKTGFYRCLKKHKGGLVVGGTTIRYRRFIKVFTRYLLTTKVIYWDDQNVYIEHRFLNPYDKFVNAIAITKLRLTKCSAETIMEDLLVNYKVKDPELANHKWAKPEMTAELAKWIESNQISSQKLRSS